MYEKLKKTIIGIVFLLCAVFGLVGWVRYGISQRHLEQSRLELRQIRTELADASDRQRDIEASVERTGRVLSESITTVQDLREALKVIREEFENMQNILRGNGRGSGSVNGDNNNTSGNTLTEDGQ